MRLQKGALAVLVAIALSTCTSPAAAKTVRIEITGLMFSPATVSAETGDTIEWANSDFVDHTASAEDGTWDIAVPAHSSRRLKLLRAGTFAYYCRVHPNMRASLVVVAH